MPIVTTKNIPKITLLCTRGVIRTGSEIKRQIIPELWDKVRSLNEFENRQDKNRYAIITGDLPGHQDSTSFYIAGIKAPLEGIENLPDDFFIYDIEESLVASIDHKGDPTSLGKTTSSVLREWLPNSSHVIKKNEELIIYPENYDRNDPKSSFEYCLFLR